MSRSGNVCTVLQAVAVHNVEVALSENEFDSPDLGLILFTVLFNILPCRSEHPSSAWTSV